MIVLFIFYVLFLIGIGYYEYKKNNDFKTFMVGHRDTSAFTVGVSIIASSIGGSATIGIIGLVYQIGFAAIWWLLSGAIGLMVLIIFLAKKVRLSKALTLPEIIQNLIGKKAKTISSIIIITAWSSILAAQFSASARILSSITNFDFNVSLIIGTFVITLYSLMGGQSSILKSDIYQYTITIMAFIFIFYWIFFNQNIKINSFDFSLVNENFTYFDIAYYILILGGSYIVCPMLFSRLLSAKNETSAQSGAIFGVFGIITSAIIITLIGLGAIQILGNNLNPDTILTKDLFKILPSYLGILLLFGLFSAIISSADSCLIVASSIFCNDILKTNSLKYCRIFTALFGIFAFCLSLYGKSILKYLLAANDIYVAGIVAPVFVSMIAKNKKPYEPLIILAILSGGFCGLIAAITDIKIYSFIGVFCATILSIISLYWKNKFT